MGSVKKVFVECLSKTSIKGVPRIVQHEVLSLRMLWLVGVLGLGGMATYTLTQLFVQYLSFATTTTISQKSIYGTNELPDIYLVVCNREPVSQTGLNKSGDIITFKQYREMLERNIPKNEDAKELFDDLFSYSGYYQYIGKENASRLGHQRDTFIADCRMLYASSSTTIRRRKCQMNNIQLVSNPQFYNCYKMPVIDSGYRAGAPVGLSLLLYMDRLQQDNDVMTDDDFLQSGGMVMSLGSSDSVNDFLYTSFDVGPGKATTARVSIVEKILAPEPHSSCVSNVYYKDFDGHNVKHSRQACINVCIQNNVSSTCECLDPELLVVPSSDLLNQTFCKRLDQMTSLAKCADTVVQNRLGPCARLNVCPPPCKENTYPVLLTTAEWPLQKQLLSLYQNVIVPNKLQYEGGHVPRTLQKLMESENKTLSSAEEKLLKCYVQENFAKITVIMSSAFATVLEEVPTITWETLISQIGGVLNVYIGISLVVCVEMLELLYKLFKCFFTDGTKASSVDRTIHATSTAF